MLQAEQLIQGRYRLVRPLGENQQRPTWLTIDEATESGTLVVLKLLSFVNAIDWQQLKLFEREAMILQQLDHPRIPAYYDYFAIDDQQHWFGLVETYIPGKTLKELLASGRRFTENEIRMIAIAVLEILQYLHELNPPIYHRDIKPSNLIWGDDERIYLVDFGGVQDKAPTLGSTFTVVGTYGYTPIEQFGGRTIPASDLYALGATLVHLLTGVCPADLPQKDLRFDYQNLVTASPQLLRWLDRLIEPDANNRLPTAMAAIAALLATQPISRVVVDESAIAAAPNLRHPRVKLTRSATGLTLEMKPLFEVPKIVAYIGLGAIGLLCLTLPPLAMIIAGIAYYSVSSEPSYAVLRCEANQVMFYRQLPGLPQIQWGHQTLPIQSIQDVLHHNLNFSSGRSTDRSRVITIRTEYREWVFGHSLSFEEGDWLVAELRAWFQR